MALGGKATCWREKNVKKKGGRCQISVPTGQKKGSCKAEPEFGSKRGPAATTKVTPGAERGLSIWGGGQGGKLLPKKEKGPTGSGFSTPWTWPRSQDAEAFLPEEGETQRSVSAVGRAARWVGVWVEELTGRGGSMGGSPQGDKRGEERGPLSGRTPDEKTLP